MKQDFLQKLLSFYHLSRQDYEKLSKPLQEIVLPSFDSFQDMNKISERIQKAIDQKEKIVIYGDYDADGVMATSILYKAFKMIGYDVGYYLPSRYLDGYGITEEKVVLLKEKGYSLIITVDNGVTAFEAIAKANELGIDVIITDHHEAMDTLPKAFGILHPIISRYGETYCSGGYVSFMLASKLLGYYDDYLLSLASISIISDMMPLKDYNRDIVRLGIDKMNRNDYLPISLLAEDDEIDEGVIGSLIAPKINAIGRMIKNTNINRLVKYFTSDDDFEVRNLYSWIRDNNDLRKDETKQVCDNLKGLTNDNSALVIISEAKEGLIGLVANRLLHEYNVPVVVFASDPDNPHEYKGSARSKKGFSITKAFQSLADKGLVKKYGGHALAGGLTIETNSFEAFRKEFISLADTYRLEEEQKRIIPIEINDINWENYHILKSFSPFGMEWEQPSFELDNLFVENLRFTRAKNGINNHIMSPIAKGIDLVSFNVDKEALEKMKYVNTIGVFRLNQYKNSKFLQFLTSSFSEAKME